MSTTETTTQVLTHENVGQMNDLDKRIMNAIQAFKKERLDFIKQTYKDNPEKVKKMLKYEEKVFNQVELCVLYFAPNRINLRNGISDRVLNLLIRNVHRIFYHTGAAHNRLFIINNPKGGPNSVDIILHWTVYVSLFRKYYSHIETEEFRDPNTGKLLYVKCKITDKEGRVYTHTAAGDDLPGRYNNWPDKGVMLKKHCIRQALAFAFPQVVSTFGFDTLDFDFLLYTSENKEEPVYQRDTVEAYPKTLSNTPKTTPKESNIKHTKQSVETQQTEVSNSQSHRRQALAKLVNQLRTIVGKEKADNVFLVYKKENALPHNIEEWPEEKFTEIINILNLHITESTGSLEEQQNNS